MSTDTVDLTSIAMYIEQLKSRVAELEKIKENFRSQFEVLVREIERDYADAIAARNEIEPEPELELEHELGLKIKSLRD